MRASELPRGYSRIPGRAERYRTPNGETVSRRQIENIAARKAGWSSWSEYQRVAQTRTYRNQLEMAVKGNGLPDTVKSYRTQAGYNSPFSRAYARFIKEGPVSNGHWTSNHSTSPDGPLAQLLVVQGYRDEDATYDVGETP